MASGVVLTDEELEGKGVAGVDTHAGTHWLCVLDKRGRVALSKEFPATAEGVRALADAIGSPGGCAAVGVEGTCSYGAQVADELSARGHRVLEVLRPGRPPRRPGAGKDDARDAERAARDVLAGEGTSVPKERGGWAEALRALLCAHDRCVGACVKLHAAALSLARMAPEAERRRWEGMSQADMMAACAAVPEEGASPLGRALLALGRAWAAARAEADALVAEIGEVLEGSCPALLAVHCCGPLSAAALAVAAGQNPRRLGSEAAFAALCGAAPIPASSGQTSGRVRLNRGGDRRANSALHTIAVRRLRHDPRTRDYVARRMSEGKSKREAVRCVKRYIAREVWRAITHPMDAGWPCDPGALREARRAAGLTQREVAAALGVSASSVSGAERGRRESRHVAMAYSRWVMDGMPTDAGEGPRAGKNPQIPT